MGRSRSSSKRSSPAPPRASLRRMSLEEIAAERQKKVKPGTFEKPPSKSPIAKGKAEQIVFLEGRLQGEGGNVLPTWDPENPRCRTFRIKATTGELITTPACTESTEAATGEAMCAQKEYQDYRPVVELLNKCHDETNWESAAPAAEGSASQGGEQALFGHELFRGYTDWDSDYKPPELEPYMKKTSVEPGVHMKVGGTDGDGKLELVVDSRPRMDIFTERMKDGKGRAWQDFLKVKEDVRQSKESNVIGKCIKRLRRVANCCGCSAETSIPLEDKFNEDLEWYLEKRGLCVSEVRALQGRPREEIERFMDIFGEHCNERSFSMPKKNAGHNISWVDTGSTPRRKPISPDVRHRKDASEEWSLRGTKQLGGCGPLGVRLTVDVRLEHQRAKGSADLRTFAKVSTRASSWLCIFDPLWHRAQFRTFRAGETLSVLTAAPLHPAHARPVDAAPAAHGTYACVLGRVGAQKQFVATIDRGRAA
jgi:hypothetical protein